MLPNRTWRCIQLQAKCRSFSTTSHRRDIPKVPLYISGQPVSTSSGGSTTTKHSKTRQPACEIIQAGEKETLEAIQSSKTAFASWRSESGWTRRKILQRVSRLLEERLPLFEEAANRDAAFSKIVIKTDHQKAMNLVDGASSTATELEGSVPQTVDNSLAMVMRRPFGPVLSIPAFNFPLTLALRSIVYPLACGNTVIFKSSPLVPQLHSLLHPLFADSGLPEGVLQILNFSEQDVAAGVERLISHPDVRMVNFTGSISLGRKLAQSCGKHLKPSVMELGGKSPAIVMPSADLKLAANNILFGAFLNSGQICMSTERCLVHESVADEFEKVLRETAEAISKREPFELVRPGAVGAVKEMVDEAIADGAKPVYPSTLSYNPTTSSLHPTILTNLSQTSKLFTEESFAPLLTLSRFSTTAEAISQANDNEAGLTSSIYTNNTLEAIEMAKELEIGAVHVNSMTVHDEHALPFGGVRASGWGRFNGRGAVESFTWSQNLGIYKGGMLPMGAL